MVVMLIVTTCFSKPYASSHFIFLIEQNVAKNIIFLFPAKSKKGGIIAGAVIGALVILAASVLVAYKLIRRSKNSAQESGPEQEQERLSKSAEVHV
jgi:hypothetical protein